MQALVYLFLIFIICLEQIHAKNVTFTPESIKITINDLPAPNASASVDKDAIVVQVPQDPELFVPSGFSVKPYFVGLTSPRILIYTPSGDILVAESVISRISCLVDTDNDGYPDQRTTFADQSNGLNRPYGMIFLNNFFYVGNRDALRRYPWTNGSRKLEGTGDILMTYNANGHWSRSLTISPSHDKIFVGIGSATNVDIDDSPRASIQQANIDGTNQKTFADGLRNPTGLAFHPVTNDMYVACQERDLIGDDLVPDYFTRVRENQFFGWPYAYLSSTLLDPRRRLANGTSERPDLVSKTQTPDVLFQAHSAVLDMLFYTGQQFPERYRNGAFAALHGSWNRNEGTGHKVVFIPFNKDTNSPMGYYEDFIRGFLTDPSGPTTFGRPVGLLVLKDGSLLFSEDGNNRLYQVQYDQSTSSGISYFISILLLITCSTLSI
ncbi:unnamed protein product [Adineta ricciae]|uniref:Pyrroloquinoline quinone-dependent pyranose dehydrogenase beta-propeller domain-containing protein n=1 Tax=Adineta ricciae TaxID=249248 RepID=A0A815Y079_ADIRI|nr:unnamed protein product [Adineta ricciae]CAF1564344.1 unnamed protein product [Adineta ricciae]